MVTSTASAASSHINNNNNKSKQKIVLYNPAIDYSAPLLQQTNPELMGSHPHAHQQQTQQQQPQPQQQQQQQQQAFNQVRQAVKTAAGAGLQQQQSLVGAAAATATTSLPLQLSEQCNISNNLNNSNNYVVNELNALKLGQQAGGGLLADSNGLLTSSISSSISSLLISNNITPTATLNNKINALWGQASAAAAAATCIDNGSSIQKFSSNNSNSADAISSLWSCASSNASSNSSSGCSSGSASGSQPSLSPTSSTMTMRQDYHSSSSKESLWSCSQTSPNNLRDSFYSVKSSSGATTAVSPTSSTASNSSQSSACSLDFGHKSAAASNLWSARDVLGGNNSYFVEEESQQFAKISNIWDIPNPAATAVKDNNKRSTDLFNDLWSSTNLSCSASTNSNSDASSNSSATDLDGSIGAIWRSPNSGRALLKQQAQAQQKHNLLAPASKPLLRPIGAHNLYGVGSAAPSTNGNGDIELAGSAACMQLFSEEFLNYLNMIN